jgi:type I restriction enzyme M protein
LRARGIDPDRAYNPKEIKALKDHGRIGEDGVPVIRRIHKGDKAEADPLHGRFPTLIGNKACVVEYEPDSDLRDTETVPLTEPGGIGAFIRREVLPHAPDAWIDEAKTATGYEISFARYFYKPQPLRSLAEIRADILAVEKETQGLMAAVLGASA